jgi:quinol monooxygenase YgiN
MLVVRFRVRCKPAKTEQIRAAMEQVIAPSRALEGLISFDIRQDLTDPDGCLATEVFEGGA